MKTLRAARPRAGVVLLGLVGLLSVLSIVSGCATGSAFEQADPAPADQAQLYIYRKFSWGFGAQNVHQVTVDGAEPALRLPNASWQRVLLAPGTHTLQITDYMASRRCQPFPMLVQARAGETLYVENTYRATGDGQGRVYVSCPSRLQEEKTALEDLKGLKRVDEVTQ